MNRCTHLTLLRSKKEDTELNHLDSSMVVAFDFDKDMFIYIESEIENSEYVNLKFLCSICWTLNYVCST
jgi:hypothetical protein